jgi:two-component system, NtrC family, sensor histidine kinase HydH
LEGKTGLENDEGQDRRTIPSATTAASAALPRRERSDDPSRERERPSDRGAGANAMFRVRASEFHIRIPTTAAVVLGSLILAFALNAAAVYQVLEEYQLLSTWVDRAGPLSVAEIKALRTDIRSRIILRSTASATLLLCTVATLWLQQRQLAIRRTLNEVKLLARDILLSIDQGVITTDLRNTITSINSAAVQILGLNWDCVGQPLDTISTAAAPLGSLTEIVATRHAPVWDEEFSLDRAGRVHRIRADAHVLKDAMGNAIGYVTLLRDVSDRYLLQERFRRMERFLSLGHLVSGLHHEIKNPLTALSIHVQLLEKRLREPTPRPVDELIGVVKSEVLRLNRVLESFSDFANLQRLKQQPTDLAALLNEVAVLIRPQADEQGVRVSLRYTGEGLYQVPLDVEKIKQAVLNLVINALEVMPHGGELVLGARATDTDFQIEVADDGPGIPRDVQDDIFKPYFSTKSHGTGMGLALTEKLVGQHGGQIQFRTSAKGTSFVITLPLEPVVRSNGEL